MWRSLAGQVKVFSGHLVNACDSMNFMALFSVIDSSEQPSKAPQAITSMVQFVSPLDTLNLDMLQVRFHTPLYGGLSMVCQCRLRHHSVLYRSGDEVWQIEVVLRHGGIGHDHKAGQQ